MKNIFSRIILGASIFLFGAAFSSCTEEMVDINDEITLGRCMTPTELVATIKNGEFIEFSWTKSKGATEFLLELYSDEQMTSKVAEKVILADEIPYTWDLDADMVYYARVKAINGEGLIDDSNWAVFDRKLETYAIKSSLNPELVDRTVNSITIKWTADPEVDHIRITPAVNAEEEFTRFEVSAEAATAGQAVVTGLNPSVNYTLTVHFKSADRGKVTAWTRPSIDGATEVSTSEALLQAITDKAAVIKVAYSETPYVIGSAVIGGPIAIYGDATAQGVQPVIQGGLKIGADATKIHLEALTFDGLSSADYPHNLTFDAAATLESITVLNCTLNNYLRGILYENSKAPTVGKIHYNDVVVNNVAGDGGDCFDIRGKANISEIVFENSTLNIGARTYFRIDANAKLESITMKNTTLNNLCFANNGNNNGIFNIRALNAAGAAPTFVLKKNVFLNMQDANNRCCLIAKNSTSVFPTEIADNFYFNCYDRFFIPQKDGSTLKGDDLATAAAEGRTRILVNGSAELTADPCVDSGRDKLNVTDADVLKAGAGDPRWHSVYVEIPEDLTQTVTATGKIWKLTDGQTFKKLADKDMVRDGIRFYVKNTPINFVKTGFEFSGAATVGEDGIPTDGAIGIKVNEPGSIVISVAESTGHSNLTVSLDGKISAAVPAGAEYQKITFANVSGEQMIYIYGCHPSTMTFLQWTSDVQVLDKVLATPVVTMDKTVVDERAKETINLTWNPIDFAGSYNVVVDGVKYSTNETKYEIETSGFSVDEAGADFSIKVTAVPEKDDYTRVESSAAELSFHVNDVPIVDTGAIPGDGTEIADEFVLNWDKLAAAVLSAVPTWNGTSTAEVSGTMTVDNVTYVSGAKVFKYDPAKPRFQYNGVTEYTDGIPTGKYISFKVTKPGTISHYVRHGSSSNYKDGEETTYRYVRILLVDADGNVKELDKFSSPAPDYSAGTTPLMTTKITAEHLAGLTSAPTVYITSETNGVNLRALEWKADPSGIPSDGTEIQNGYVLNWDRLAAAVLAAVPTWNGTSTAEVSGTMTVDNVTYVSGAKVFKYDPAKPRFQYNGVTEYTDGIPTGKYISFKVTKPGTISHYVRHGSSSNYKDGEETTYRYVRILLVDADGNVKELDKFSSPAPDYSAGTTPLMTTKITAEHLAGLTSAPTVYITSETNGVNLRALEWVEE